MPRREHLEGHLGWHLEGHLGWHLEGHLEGHLEDTSILGLRLDLSANEYSTMSIDFSQGTCSKFKITPFFGKKT